MSVRAVSPVSPYAVSVDTVSVGHSDNASENEELSVGCLCYSCGNPEAAMDEDFLYLFRPREGHTITLCERSNGNVTEHRLQRIHFGNTRYLRQFLKPDLHHRPLKFDLGQLCRDHQRGWCQRGPMCRFIHICRKLALKAPSPQQQYNAHGTPNTSQTNSPHARIHSGVQATPSPTSSQGRTRLASFFPKTDAAMGHQFESNNAQTMQGLVAAYASMIANATPNTSISNPNIFGLHSQPAIPMPTYFNPASPLHPAVAAAYSPLFVAQMAAQLAANNSSTSSFEPSRATNPNNTAEMSFSQFMPQMPVMPSMPVSAPSTVAAAVAPTQRPPTTPSGVPASIADIWKTPEQQPVVPPLKCVGEHDASQINVMLQSLRDFAQAFPIPNVAATAAQTVH